MSQLSSPFSHAPSPQPLSKATLLPTARGKHVNVRAVSPAEYCLKTRGVRRVFTEEGTHVCMAAAIILAQASRDDLRNKYQMSGNKKARVTRYLTQKATELCLQCDVDPNFPSGPIELNKFSQALQINLHVYDI